MIHKQFSKKNTTQTSNFGFATLLLCFTMICIITFAVLSLITANSDWILSKKVASKNASYHQVEEKAYEHIAKIDSSLAKCFTLSNSKESYFYLVEQELSNESGELSYGNDGLYYKFCNELSDSQTLEVTIYITYPNASTTSFFKITQWQAITDTSFETDNTLNLIN
ncbi:MAG: hypothetical protein U0K86_06250 [Agathobacter sp.]|nr:hypothetical protein [Agathobacter sp.]